MDLIPLLDSYILSKSISQRTLSGLIKRGILSSIYICLPSGAADLFPQKKIIGELVQQIEGFQDY